MTTTGPENDAVVVMITDLVSPMGTLVGSVVAVARRELVAELLVPALRNDAVLLAAIARVRPWCRVCGCTDESACEGGCSWVEPDLCSEHSPVLA